MPSEIPSYSNGLQAGSSFPRTERLRKRNRRVALIALFVALLLLVGSAIYIAFWGGTNKGPMQPYTDAVPDRSPSIADQNNPAVILANAGIHSVSTWIPAFARMTNGDVGSTSLRTSAGVGGSA